MNMQAKQNKKSISGVPTPLYHCHNFVPKRAHKVGFLIMAITVPHFRPREGDVIKHISPFRSRNTLKRFCTIYRGV
jgi:hypothetical protein